MLPEMESRQSYGIVDYVRAPTSTNSRTDLASVRSMDKKCSAFAKIGNAPGGRREETARVVWAL